MTNSMTISGASAPMGEITLHFSYFLDDGPPHAWLDIVSDSSDDAQGGLALNCLDIGDVPVLDGIFGKRYAFGAADENMGTALSGSVFWKPGEQTLELTALTLQVGERQGAQVPVTIDATCFDHDGNAGIAVSITGLANIAKA